MINETAKASLIVILLSPIETIPPQQNVDPVPSTPKTVRAVAKENSNEAGPRVVTVAGQKYEVRVVNKKRLMIPIGSPPTLHRRHGEYGRVTSPDPIVPSVSEAPSTGMISASGETSSSSGETSSASMALSIDKTPSVFSAPGLPVTHDPPTLLSPTSIVHPVQISHTPLQTPQKSPSLPSKSIQPLQRKQESKMKIHGSMKRPVEKRQRSRGGEPKTKRMKVHKVVSKSM